MKLIEYLSSKLNSFFSRGFQTDQHMVPFLAETLKTLIRSFMNLFILKQVMAKVHTLMKLLKVDMKDVYQAFIFGLANGEFCQSFLFCRGKICWRSKMS